MLDHLYHNVYGAELHNSIVFEQAVPVLIDGVWYWQELL